jgi:hypothetical protein
MKQSLNIRRLRSGRLAILFATCSLAVLGLTLGGAGTAAAASTTTTPPTRVAAGTVGLVGAIHVPGSSVAAVGSSDDISPRIAATSCVAWGLLGTCRTATIPASSGHRIFYAIPPCGWGNVFDAANGRHVGPSNVLGSGGISGLFGSYYMIVRNAVGTVGCTGVLSS